MSVKYKIITNPAFNYYTKVVDNSTYSFLITEKIFSTIITQSWDKGRDERRFVI